MRQQNQDLKVRLTKLEHEGHFLKTLLASTVKNSVNPIAALLSVPDQYVTEDMMPSGVSADVFNASRSSIAAVLAQQHTEACRRVPPGKKRGEAGAGCPLCVGFRLCRPPVPFIGWYGNAVCSFPARPRWTRLCDGSKHWRCN